jgi:hypothetical protein
MVAQATATKQPVPALKEVPYSNRLKKQIKVVARAHTKVARVREYHHRKIARVLARQYRRFACEEHGVKFMFANRRTARAAADRAIFSLKKRAEATLGRRYSGVANRREGVGGNSQTCLCGAPTPKDLSDRIHRCAACGLGLGKEPAGRDHVSANIAQVIAFGTISDTLTAKYPAGRQPVVTRGGSEGRSGESPAAGPQATATLESPRKRGSSASGVTRDGEPALGGETVVNRPGNGVLPTEPTTRRSGGRARTVRMARRKPGGLSVAGDRPLP